MDSTKELPYGPGFTSEQVYSSNGVKVTAFLVKHDPMTPAYGFRVDYLGHSFVYSGDTTYSDNLVANSQNVDVLVHEVYGFPRNAAPEIYDYHTSPEDVARVFNMANPRLAVFTHLVMPPGTTPKDLIRRTRRAGYRGPLKAGRDLMVINIHSNSRITTKAEAGSEQFDDTPETSTFVEVAGYRHSMAP